MWNHVEHDKRWTGRASDDGDDPRISGHCYCPSVQHESMGVRLSVLRYVHMHNSVCLWNCLSTNGSIALYDSIVALLQVIPIFPNALRPLVSSLCCIIRVLICETASCFY